MLQKWTPFAVLCCSIKVLKKRIIVQCAKAGCYCKKIIQFIRQYIFIRHTVDGPEKKMNLISLFRTDVNTLGRSYLDSNIRNKQTGLEFKGQLISKAIYDLLTSSKKQTNEFVCSFFGEVTARQFCSGI